MLESITLHLDPMGYALFADLTVHLEGSSDMPYVHHTHPGKHRAICSVMPSWGACIIGTVVLRPLLRGA